MRIENMLEEKTHWQQIKPALQAGGAGRIDEAIRELDHGVSLPQSIPALATDMRNPRCTSGRNVHFGMMTLTSNGSTRKVLPESLLNRTSSMSRVPPDPTWSGDAEGAPVDCPSIGCARMAFSQVGTVPPGACDGNS